MKLPKPRPLQPLQQVKMIEAITTGRFSSMVVSREDSVYNLLLDLQLPFSTNVVYAQAACEDGRMIFRGRS